MSSLPSGDGILSVMQSPVDALTIRPARGTEFDDIVAVDNDASALFASVGLPLDFAPDHPFARAERARWARALESANAFVAEAPDGEIVGIAVLGRVNGFPYLDQLSVRGAFMRRGVGTRLMKHAIAWAGLQDLWLTTYAHVPWNGPYYQRLGFLPVPQEHCPSDVVAILEEQRLWLPEAGQRIAMVRAARFGISV